VKAVALTFAVLGAILLICGLAYMWATGGIPGREVEPAWLTRFPFAHRGLHTEGPEAPENSLAAFERATEAGYGFELDVQMTADGEVVIMHDADLERMTGDPRLISDVTIDELRSLRLLDGEEPVPTLAQALAVSDGQVPVLVEIKNEGDVGELEDAVAEELASYMGEVAVISFNPYSLARVAQAQPGIVRGQLASTFEGVELEAWKRLLLANLLMNWRSRPDFIAHEYSTLPRATTSMQRSRGRYLLGWTPSNLDERVQALEHCDNIIADPGALDSD
jgi:glycerophosphoryl diester phosphodiesterase